MAESIITQDLTKLYASIRALDGLSLSVRENIVFGLLGPNGAGKTTLLRLLTTLTKPTSGYAQVLGYDISRQGLSIRRLIGVLAQQNYLDQYLTARENLAVHAKMHRMAAADYNQRIDELLSIFELSARQHDHPSTYSSGMQRRLALARALLHRPRVLFLDEPTTGLDPQARRAVWDQIDALRGRVTVFLTTHYMEEADALCDEVAIIDRGRVLVKAPPSELKRQAGGDDHYEIEVRGDAESYRERMAGVPGVQVTGSQDGLVRLDLASRGSLRAVLDRVGADDLLQLTRRSPTLEDVFIKMTGRRLRD
ncbi:MAG: ATP-binding cassette domain-containing protein [Chloroflexi bacterium]|nr:ATP-binding cassette domain-containing protein [Chloroflexota bacterium]